MRVKPMDPVPSSSQSIEIKTEETSSTSDHLDDFVGPLWPDIQADSSSLICQQLVWVRL